LITGACPAFAAAPCAAMIHARIPAAEIALPSRGVDIETAKTYPAEADLPKTCRVIGKIISTEKSAPPIRFELNLPDAWNGKALQFGGGGLDGVLVDGLHSMPGNAPLANPIPNPLARGYATFGSDGGHQAITPADASFGRIPQALANYTGEAVKRTHDAAVAIMRRFYGISPRRTYFAGGSKGGHEGLVAAQRYGADYDGIIAYYPAKDSVALIFGWGALSEAAYGPDGGALSPAKQAFLKRSVMGACDALDGLKDGVISATAACAATISPASFRCAPGATDTDACLTDAEARLIELGLQRRALPFPLANGVAAIGPFPMLSGSAFEGILFSPVGPDATAYGAFVNGIVRDFWTGNSIARFAGLDTQKFQGAIMGYSRQADATSTDMDKFVSHGGKLILVQGATDMLVPPSATTDYYERLAAHYGPKTDGFVKYFVQPGYGHGFGDFALSWDSLGALDSWSETGVFPANPVAADGNPATRDRQMPLCEYPAYPRYDGGDARNASSFRCVAQ